MKIDNFEFNTTPEVEEVLGEDYSLKEEKYRIGEAEKAGLQVLRANDHTLLFDLDSEEALSIFKERLPFLLRKMCIQATITKSKSGHWHAVVEVDPTYPPINETQRCCIQACFGSDWKREILGIMRTLNGQDEVNLLFRPQPLEVVEIIERTTL